MHRMQARLALVRAESPTLLFWGAALVFALSLLTWIEEPEAPVVTHVLDFASALVMLACGLAILKTSVRDTLVPWLTAIGVGSVGLSVTIQMGLYPKAQGFAYLVIVLMALGPVTLDWRAFGAVATALFAAIWAVVVEWPIGHASEWIFITVGALVSGALLLAARLRSTYALADARQEMAERATTDALTGLLNRHGFEEEVERLLALAHRLDCPVWATFVDIEGLKRANDQHGHAFGDEVIRCAAVAVLANTRADDLVTRWGGDEILIVGIGDQPDPDQLTARLRSTVDSGTIDRGKWPGELSVGVAVARPDALSVSALVAGADASMYERRAATRVGPLDASP